MDKCGVCHARPARGRDLVLCEVCRARADKLIAGTSRAETLVTGSGEWDGTMLPRPAKRFPGRAATHDS